MRRIERRSPRAVCLPASPTPAPWTHLKLFHARCYRLCSCSLFGVHLLIQRTRPARRASFCNVYRADWTHSGPTHLCSAVFQSVATRRRSRLGRLCRRGAKHSPNSRAPHLSLFASFSVVLFRLTLPLTAPRPPTRLPLRFSLSLPVLPLFSRPHSSRRLRFADRRLVHARTSRPFGVLCERTASGPAGLGGFGAAALPNAAGCASVLPACARPQITKDFMTCQ